MNILRHGLLALLGLTYCTATLADTGFPDLGPKLRDFDPAKDCKCVQTSIARKQAIVDGYRELAKSYSNTLKDLGDGRSAPTWVDPNTLSPQQISRLIALNKKLNEEELKMAQGAPEADCGFPPDKEIVLETSARTGELPSKQAQEEAKPLFPSEQIFDAVMWHESYHASEWSAHNTGHNVPAGSMPSTRTPYGRALEEARGNEIEMERLKKLTKQCKGHSFSGVSFVSHFPPNLAITLAIAGINCDDPLTGNWRITQRTSVRGLPVTKPDSVSHFDNDCLATGSANLARRLDVVRNTSPHAGGWSCEYNVGPPETITIHLISKPGMGYSPLEQSKSVPLKTGGCD